MTTLFNTSITWRLSWPASLALQLVSNNVFFGGMYIITWCFSVEGDSHTHGLVEFIKEGCTAVIAMQCIVSNIESLKQVGKCECSLEQQKGIFCHLSGKPY